MRVDKGSPSLRPPLKVEQHSRKQVREYRECECDQTHQNRLEPAKTRWRFLQPLEQARPKIGRQLRGLPGRQCRSQSPANEVELAIVVVHGRISLVSRSARTSPAALA